jgi:hypothetical protein
MYAIEFEAGAGSFASFLEAQEPAPASLCFLNDFVLLAWDEDDSNYGD